MFRALIVSLSNLCFKQKLLEKVDFIFNELTVPAMVWLASSGKWKHRKAP